MPAMKDLVNGVPRYRHFINGQWPDSTVTEWIEVENPATGAVIATVPKGGADDADRALVAAAAAQPAWEALPPIERAKLLIGLARLILENRDRLARLVVAEQGKPLTEARGEIARGLIEVYRALGGGWQIRCGDSGCPPTDVPVAEAKPEPAPPPPPGQLPAPRKMEPIP